MVDSRIPKNMMPMTSTMITTMVSTSVAGVWPWKGGGRGGGSHTYNSLRIWTHVQDAGPPHKKTGPLTTSPKPTVAICKTECWEGFVDQPQRQRNAAVMLPNCVPCRRVKPQRIVCVRGAWHLSKTSDLVHLIPDVRHPSRRDSPSSRPSMFRQSSARFGPHHSVLRRM